MKKKGFTLIELLVVVLIIGVLTAIALPQYEKAVEKSKAVEPMALLTALGHAQERYVLANGEFANSFDVLDVEIPNSYQPSDKCTVFIKRTYIKNCVANQDWAIGWSSDDYWKIFFAVRLRGPYALEENNPNQGALIYLSRRPPGTSQANPEDEHTLMCNATGDYCKSVVGGKRRQGWLGSASGGYLFVHYAL